VSEPNEIPPTAEVTRILASAQGGDAAARDRVFATVRLRSCSWLCAPRSNPASAGLEELANRAGPARLHPDDDAREYGDRDEDQVLVGRQGHHRVSASASRVCTRRERTGVTAIEERFSTR
jgi:hypothetical protein